MRRDVCSPLHHNLLFIKQIYFLPPFVPFHWTANSDKVPEPVMMIYESHPEDVVRLRGCAVGVNLGGDTERVNKKYVSLFHNSK